MSPPARLCVSLTLLFVATSPGLAQECGPWQLIGPFKHPRGSANIEAEQDVEELLSKMRAGHPALGLSERYEGKLDKVGWQTLEGDSTDFDVGAIQFATALTVPEDARAGWSDNAVVYLYRNIAATEAGLLEVSCGSDDGMRLWWNGELLVDAAVPRALNVSSHALELPLEAGSNHLFVKVANGGGGWGFQIKERRTAPVDEPAIAAAIEGGMAHLLDHQLVDGSWGEHANYHAGATAYAAYALLHCGVKADDPAIERARAYVIAHPSPYTYSTACELLFLCKLGRPGDREFIEERLERLLGYQAKAGLFGYPTHPDGHSADDLSTTLYASLAMSAAEAYGVEVPEKTWKAAIEGALSMFAGVTAKDSATGVGAGFRYRLDHPITGSMTTGGITILTLAREALGGKFPGRVAREAQTAFESAQLWLNGRMNWGENPGQAGAHHYFWLYGIERVGDLLGLEELGGVPWYSEGAEFLVNGQNDQGAWGSTVHTILALLFLERASRPAVSGESSRDDAWNTEDPEARVRIAATGGRLLTAWVQSLHREVSQELVWPAAQGGGVRVKAVDFTLKPVAGGAELLLGRTELDPERPSQDQRLAVQAAPPERGDWDLVGRVHAIRPLPEGTPNPDPETAETVELLSPPLRISVRDVLHPEQLTYPEQGTQNLLAGVECKFEASSELSGQAAAQAADGKQGTAWQFTAEDASPWIELKLGRSAKAKRIALSHAVPHLKSGTRARVRRVAVTVDGKQRVEAQLPSDPLRKAVFELGGAKRVKRLRLEVLALEGGKLGAVSTGLAEIELLPE